jgi:hypothetical protein
VEQLQLEQLVQDCKGWQRKRLRLYICTH